MKGFEKVLLCATVAAGLCGGKVLADAASWTNTMDTLDTSAVTNGVNSAAAKGMPVAMIIFSALLVASLMFAFFRKGGRR